jgi:hypothetical protein
MTKIASLAMVGRRQNAPARYGRQAPAPYVDLWRGYRRELISRHNSFDSDGF